MLADRARKSAPNAQLVTIDNFLDDPALDSLYAALTQISKASELKEKAAPAPEPEPAEKKPAIALVREGIQLGCDRLPREDAIRASGELLVRLGCVDEPYVDAMVERDKLTSVYLGMGVAIPHGTGDAKDSVKKTGVVFQQYPQGIDFDGEKAYLVFGIAGRGEEHLEVLANICKILEDDAVVEKLKTTTDVDWVLSVLAD